MSAVAWLLEDKRHALVGDNYVAAAGSREVSWLWEVLDRDDQVVGVLDGVESGAASFQATSEAGVRTGGRLTWRGSEVPDWSQMRLHPVYRAAFPDGTSMAWELGVFIPSSPGEKWSGPLVTCDLTLYDKLVLLEIDKARSTYTIRAGADVLAAVRSLILSVGEDRIALTEGAPVARVAMSWEPDTPKLQIINEALLAVGYAPLWCDGGGQFRVEPFVEPIDRPLRREFVAGPGSIHLPEWGRDVDTWGVPNSVTVIGRDGAFQATATNIDPASPTSIPRVGMTVSQIVTNSDAATAALCAAEAKRTLLAASAPAETFALAHAPTGDRLDILARFAPKHGSTDVTGILRSWSITNKPDDLVQATIQRVAT